MSIKIKLWLSILVAGGIAVLAFSLILTWTSRQVGEAIEQSQAMDKVVKGVFELNIITNDYLLYYEDRAQTQWDLRYASLAQLLAGARFKGPEEEAMLEQITQIHADIQPLFSQLLTNHERQGLSEEEMDLSRDLEQLLVSQLMVKTQTMVTVTFQLAEAASVRVEIAQRRGSYLLMAVGGILLALIVSIIILTSNGIVARVRNLQRGTEIIAAGDLDHHVEIRSDDEISQLSRAFNEMTHKLKESYAGLNEEITTRKQAEEALQEYSERLEVMVEERTKELKDAQEELVRKEKLAILGQLAGGVGHDLRNPLGAIKNAAYFLNMVLKEPDPEVKETLEILEKEVGTSEAIISSLLDFARAKSPTKRKISVNEILQETLSRITVPENVEVVQELDETLPKSLVDPDQLGQVFGNIILNGIQAMTEGGQLTIKSEAPAPGRVSVFITDTGVGIPEEQLEKLFEPLYTTRAKGIGLGLAIVKTLVEGHRGTIEVESEPGKGSTFTVKLPTGMEESKGAGEQGR